MSLPFCLQDPDFRLDAPHWHSQGRHSSPDTTDSETRSDKVSVGEKIFSVPHELSWLKIYATGSARTRSRREVLVCI
jgi:hypothetical protein